MSTKPDPFTYFSNFTNVYFISMNKWAVPAQLTISNLLWKGRQNFSSNVTLYPCGCSRQNHLVGLLLPAYLICASYTNLSWYYTILNVFTVTNMGPQILKLCSAQTEKYSVSNANLEKSYFKNCRHYSWWTSLEDLRRLFHKYSLSQFYCVLDLNTGGGGAFPYKSIRNVPFFRVSFFSINSWTEYENWSEIPKRVMIICSRTKSYCFQEQ